jgi:hypothetical protein
LWSTCVFSLSVYPFFISTKLSDAWERHAMFMQFQLCDRFFSALFSIFVCFLWIFYVNFESLKLVQIKDGASLS